MPDDAYLHDVDEEAGYTTLYIRSRQGTVERVITMRACVVPGTIMPLGWTRAIADAFAQRLEGGSLQVTDETIYYTEDRARADGRSPWHGDPMGRASRRAGPLGEGPCLARCQPRARRT